MVQTLPLPAPLRPVPVTLILFILEEQKRIPTSGPLHVPPPPACLPAGAAACLPMSRLPWTCLFLTIAAKDAPLQPTPYPSLFDFVRSIYLHLRLFYSHCVHSPPPTPPEESGSDLVTAVPSASRTGPGTLVVTRIFIDYLMEDRSNVV